MKKQTQKLTEAQLLRKKAEELFKTKILSAEAISDESDVLKLNHELSVHQIELEIQNAELLNAKENLEIAVEKYTDLYDFAPTGYLTFSVDGQIVGLNLTASRMLGKERSYIIKNMFGSFLTEDTKQKYYTFLKEVFDTKIEQTCEVVINKRGSTPTYVYLVGLVTKEGKTCDVSMIDVTERKLAAEKLYESNKKLEQSMQLNADKDLFISILAHDLRNPLSVQLGLSELLSEKISESAGEEVNHLTNEIVKSTHFTYDLLEDILKWSRVRMGRVPFEPQLLSFDDICIDIINSLSPIAGTKGIILRCNTEKEINVLADKEMLKAVFRNLISNAIKFTNQYGKIMVSAELANSSIIFSVSDNGVGIAPDRVNKLFEISEIESTTGTSHEKGTGLGLLLCKDFVEKHGGKIWVQSQYGLGSTFYFEIPSEHFADVPSETKNVSEQTHNYNLKVLITEDNEGLRMILGTMMKNYAKEILYAETGIEAVTLSAENPDIDLILMDISMPKMDGLEATKLIRMINKKVVIIVETAKSLLEIAEETKGKGINDYFFKPYSRSFLNELIIKHFGK